MAEAAAERLEIERVHAELSRRRQAPAEDAAPCTSEAA